MSDYTRLHPGWHRSGYQTISVTQEMRGYALKTVRTFGKIVDLPLTLSRGGGDQGGSNNGRDIRVPVGIPDRDYYRKTEQQLAHILFKTDSVASAAFVARYAKQIVEATRKVGVEIATAEITHAIQGVVDVLETFRVTSLWGRLYAGSFAQIQELLAREAEGVLDPTTSIGDILAALALGGDPECGGLGRFKPYCVEALRKVRGRSFKATLIITKWLIKRLVDEMIRERDDEAPPECPEFDNNAQQLLEDSLEGDDESDDALQDAPSDSSGLWSPDPPRNSPSVAERADILKSLMGQLEHSQEGKLDWNNTTSTSSSFGAAEVSGELAKSALTIALKDPDKVSEALEESAQEMEGILKDTQDALSGPQTAGGGLRDWLCRDISADVDFKEVTDVVPHDLESGDKRLVEKLRRTFSRIMGRRRVTLEDTGEEIDVRAYIARKMDPYSGAPVFRAVRSGRGFAVTLLVDLSSSMRGLRIQQATRACTILRRALDYPFVDLRVMGFSAPQRGVAKLHQFPRGKDVDLDAYVGGSTPLHVGVEVCIRQLLESSTSKHLVVLTDGEPIFATRRGAAVSMSAMMEATSEAVRYGSRKGVHTTALMVSEGGYGRIRDEDMRVMFGSKGNWGHLTGSEFGAQLVSGVVKSFTQFLRSK